MSLDPILIGVDLGTGACKAGVYDLQGRVVGEGSAPCRVERPQTGWVEQDAHEYWRSMVRAVRQALAGVEAGRVVGMACCGHTPSLVLVDDAGEPVRPAIIWQDSRAVAEAAVLEAEIPAERWREWLGMDLPRNASYPPARLRWLQTHERTVLERTRWILQPKDYLNLRLTGIAASDYWDNKGLAHIGTGAPVAAFQGLFGIDPGIIPPAGYPHRRLGSLAPAAAEELGLPAGIPVAVGWSDAMSGMLGTGALAQAGLAFDLAGTSEIVGMTVDGEPGDVDGLLMAPVLDTPLRIVYGPTQTSGGALQWFLDGFYPEAPSPERLAELAAPSPSGLTFLPYLQGERAPIWDSAARGVFFGVNLSHGREHFLRAVLEGVACSIRHVLSTAEQVSDRQVEEVRISGGGARLAVWNGVKASVLGKPLRVTATPEAGTSGAAMLAGMAAGEFAGIGEASEAMVRLSEPVYPDEGLARAYDELYQKYRALYERVKGVT